MIFYLVRATACVAHDGLHCTLNRLDHVYLYEPFDKHLADRNNAPTKCLQEPQMTEGSYALQESESSRDVVFRIARHIDRISMRYQLGRHCPEPYCRFGY